MDAFFFFFGAAGVVVLSWVGYYLLPYVFSVLREKSELSAKVGKLETIAEYERKISEIHYNYGRVFFEMNGAIIRQVIPLIGSLPSPTSIGNVEISSISSSSPARPLEIQGENEERVIIFRGRKHSGEIVSDVAGIHFLSGGERFSCPYPDSDRVHFSPDCGMFSQKCGNMKCANIVVSNVDATRFCSPSCKDSHYNR